MSQKVSAVFCYQMMLIVTYRATLIRLCQTNDITIINSLNSKYLNLHIFIMTRRFAKPLIKNVILFMYLCIFSNIVYIFETLLHTLQQGLDEKICTDIDSIQISGSVQDLYLMYRKLRLVRQPHATWKMFIERCADIKRLMQSHHHHRFRSKCGIC